MADIVATIGSGQDFTTIAGWFASVQDGGTGGAGDRYIGRVMDDAAFVEDVTATLDPSADVAILEADDAVKHDGTPGTGARLQGTLDLSTFRAYIVQDMEVFAGDPAAQFLCQAGEHAPVEGCEIRRCLFYGVDFTYSGSVIDVVGPQSSSTDAEMNINNCMIFRHTSTNQAGNRDIHGVVMSANGRSCWLLNCAISDLDSTDGSLGSGAEISGLEGDNEAEVHLYNNIIGNIGNQTATGAIEDYRAVGAGITADRNMSEDTTAPGTTNYQSEDPGLIFVDDTPDSEDLHIVAGTNAIDNGADLTTLGEPGEHQFDIDDFDRDTIALWDLGADQQGLPAGGVVFAGAISAVSTLTGTLTPTRHYVGAISAVSTLTGTLTPTRHYVGAISAVSTLTGTLTPTRHYVGAISAASSLTGTLTVSGAVQFSGAISAVSSLTGTLTPTRHYTGATSATSTLTGTLTVGAVVLFSGSVSAVSSITGTLIPTRHYVGTVSATSALTGVLTVGAVKLFVGSIVCQSSLTGNLTRTVRLSGSILVVSVLSGSYTVVSAFVAGNPNVWRLPETNRVWSL